jgi:3-methylfumaryl-CoA hydratase
LHEVGLAETIAGWRPPDVLVRDAVSPFAVAAFSSLLGLPATVAEQGKALPPLWHWFSFVEPTVLALGEDGHPAEGAFLPPVPHRRRMIAGGRLRVGEPLVVGEKVQRASTLARAEVKHGRSGEMAFVSVRHEFRRDGRTIMIEEQDVVYRSQHPGSQRRLHTPPTPTPQQQSPGRWELRFVPDPTMLFRFSALTYNAHRIHYDQPYATAVEGYPGLVVHGPLLALALLEIPRRHLPERAVTSFEYRLTNPVFANTAVTASGRRASDGVELWACADGAPAAIRASARFDEAPL